MRKNRTYMDCRRSQQQIFSSRLACRGLRPRNCRLCRSRSGRCPARSLPGRANSESKEHIGRGLTQDPSAGEFDIYFLNFLTLCLWRPEKGRMLVLLGNIVYDVSDC